MKLLPDKPIRTESNAEKKLFPVFAASALPDNWYCFHSLSLSRHIHKREGEIDFLIVNSQGIMVLEVKGGGVSRQDGQWLFTNHRGETTAKRESPFDQAKTAMYSLKSTITNVLGQDYEHVVYGYGCVFPDVDWTVNSPEWSPEMVYSRVDDGDMDGFVANLQAHWAGKQRITKEITRAQLNKLVEFLRGEFNLVKPLPENIAELEAEFINLTQEQSSCLTHLEENERVWITGAAGTGKTLLAYEQARRNQGNKIRTLFLCYNKFLASNLRHIFQSEFAGQELFVEISTVHGYMASVIERQLGASALTGRARNNEFYNDYLPKLFSEAVGDTPSYDRLIIDEAQDVMVPAYINPLGMTIEGGWKDGSWSIFLDVENQKNMFARLDEETVKRLRGSAAKYRLDKNCRNSKNIAVQCEIISGLECCADSAIEGVKVRFIWYENDFDQSVKVGDAINKVLESGVQAGDIIVLSREKNTSSLAGTGRLRLNADLQEYRIDMVPREKRKTVTYSTVQAFKGLESPVVVITDISGMEEEYDNLLNYVGMTRARSHLIVALHSSQRKNYNEKVKATV
jgi:nucleoside-triphosphatase THEP1